MFQIWNVSDVSDVSSGLMTFECLSMFINVYQRLSTFINVSGGFIQVQFQQIVVPFEDGFISVVDPPKTRSITDIFEPILGVFQQPLATPIGFFLKPLTGDPRQILQPVASGTYGCANGCMGKDSHVRPAGEVSIPKKATLQSAIMPECFDQAK
jgi:hypothetical protein